MTDILNHVFTFHNNWYAAIMALIGVITFLAAILRCTSLIPEPEVPLKTPVGKLPFFDGIALYGIVIFLLLGAAKGATMFLWH